MSAKWYYRRGDAQAGPISAAQLKQLAQNGQLSPADLIWKEGLANWVPAQKAKDLFSTAFTPTQQQTTPERSLPTANRPQVASFPPIAMATNSAGWAPIPTQGPNHSVVPTYGSTALHLEVTLKTHAIFKKSDEYTFRIAGNQLTIQACNSTATSYNLTKTDAQAATHLTGYLIKFWPSDRKSELRFVLSTSDQANPHKLLKFGQLKSWLQGFSGRLEDKSTRRTCLTLAAFEGALIAAGQVVLTLLVTTVVFLNVGTNISLIDKVFLLVALVWGIIGLIALLFRQAWGALALGILNAFGMIEAMVIAFASVAQLQTPLLIVFCLRMMFLGVFTASYFMCFHRLRNLKHLLKEQPS